MKQKEILKARQLAGLTQTALAERVGISAQAMNGYDPDIIGYCWDNSNPRIQLEPRGNRGYIELRSMKKK